jgi:Ca2+-binding RTX toxin-like protein
VSGIKRARRGLAIIAATSIGATGLLVGSTTAPASAAANLVLDYTCTYPLINQQDLTVDITVDLPASAQVGVPTAPFDIVAVSTVSATTTSGLTLIGAKTIEGTAVSHVDVQAPQVDLPDVQVPVTVPQTPVPASGAFDITATGQTPSLTFPEAGEGTIDVGNLDLRMTARNSAGDPIALPGGHPDGSFDAPCTVKPGQVQRLASFPILGAPAPTCNGLSATITGSGTINGTAGADVIVGSSGADVVNGRGGNDTICAGGGNDTVLQGAAPDGADRIDGQAGVDTLSYASRTTPVNVTLTGTTANDGAAGEADAAIAVENVTGGAANDTLTGSGVANLLIGGSGNDTLNGSTGNDVEQGGSGDDKFTQGATANGADVLNGQAGTDTASYGSRTAPVVVTLGASATGNDGAAGEADNLTVENATGGNGNDTLTGNGGANVLIGGNGNDALRLRDNIVGNDSGNGGSGTDTATFDSGDTITNVP